MNREEVIDIIRAERECVYRQGRTGECCRDDMGCGACDLVQEDTNIIEAYDIAIESLKDRPQGKWRRVSMDKYVQHAYHFYRCSECGGDVIGEPNFCPNCGASMRKDGEGKDGNVKEAEAKKCPNCGSDLYEYCFMCCYEGEKVTRSDNI